MILSRPDEELKEHIGRVSNNYKYICEEKNIENIIRNSIEKVCKEEKIDYGNFIKNAVDDVIFLHDEGKKSKYFQAYVGNKEYDTIQYTKNNKRHSILSTYCYLKKYYYEIEKLGLKGKEGRLQKRKIREIICCFANIINCHHGSLVNYDKKNLIDSITNHYDNYNEAFFDGYDEIIEVYKSSLYTFSGTGIYFLTKYIYSILVTCDFMAVHEFKKEKKLKLNLLDTKKKEEFLSNLNNNQIIKDIRDFEQNKTEITGINKYRTEMFLESERNLKASIGNMFYLEAPTGSGKSLTSLNLALNMIDSNLDKIIYVAPFTNIIEQTCKDIKNIIGDNNKDIVRIDSKTEIVIESEDNVDYDIDYLDSLLMNYPFTVISHVRLFDILFGTKRKQALGLALMANSVLILDEIQSYKNKIWKSVINILKEYSDILNIKIIIMSATLPKLDKLIVSDNSSIRNLINRKEYYFDFFKTRVRNDYTLLDNKLENREDRIENLIEKIDEVIRNNDNSRILIGTIRRATCHEIYKKLENRYKSLGYSVSKLTSETTTIRKNEIIKNLKKKDENGDYIEKKIILVATQCVEAGVDIDMNVGFKNIGTLDSDEQFLGRIERNFKNRGVCYFYKVDEVSKIYLDDYRADKTLELIEYRSILDEKNFDLFYEKCFEWIIKKENKQFEMMIDCLRTLKYKEIHEGLELIEKTNIVNLLVNCSAKIDNEIIILEDVLNEYNQIKQNYEMKYSEKEILLSRLRRKIDIFSCTTNKFKVKNIDQFREFGIYKVIDDGSEYYTNKVDGYITENSELDIEGLLEGKLFY